MEKGKWSNVWLGALILAVVLTGCAAGNVKFAATDSKVDMSKYSAVAVKVTNDAGGTCPADVPQNLEGAVINQLQTTFSGAFETVRPSPTGDENEMLAEVHIVKYKKGSRFARAMLIGLGSSKISTDVIISDSKSKQPLKSGKLLLVWAIGGVVGASRGIEDLVNDAGAKVADSIVACKSGTETVDGRPRASAKDEEKTEK